MEFFLYFLRTSQNFPVLFIFFQNLFIVFSVISRGYLDYKFYRTFTQFFLKFCIYSQFVISLKFLQTFSKISSEFFQIIFTKIPNFVQILHAKFSYIL